MAEVLEQPTSRPGLSHRFTLDGDAALEGRLDALCQRVASEVQRIIPPAKLELILLGGGYGRGEGGVLITDEGHAPYNDLEFYVLVRGNPLLNQRRFGHALHALGERLTPEAGIEVEFKLLSLRKLRESPVTMFYYDLVVGNRVIFGDPQQLTSCEHHRAAHRIPLYEATRLLMNRCSGLLFAKALLQRATFTAEDADFVERNIAKAKLAMGDVILAASGQYHSSCRERHRRLEKLAATDGNSWINPFVETHADGVEFKLHPIQSRRTHGELAAEHARIGSLAQRLWLWLENRRLAQQFGSPEGYALSAVNKCPETNLLRNCAVNARTFGASALFASGSSRYPRERMLNTLPLLLWIEHPFENATMRAHIQRNLRSDAGDLDGAVAAYKQIWGRFN